MHPGGDDRECWLDLLGRPLTPDDRISIPEYEQASYNAWEHPAMAVRYLNHRPTISGRPREERCGSRVDERGVRVVVAEVDHVIVTCYHLHESRGRHRSPRETLPDQLVEMFQRRLRRDLAAGRESEHDPPIEEIRWAW